MERHVRLVHESYNKSGRNFIVDRPATETRINPQLARSNLDPEDPQYYDEWHFKGFNQMIKSMNSIADFKRNMATSGSMIHANVNSLQEQLNQCRAELYGLHSNYWRMSKYEIQGVSGYFCKRCLSFSSHFIRDLGYDKTAEGKHCCDERKVETIYAVSIKKDDIYQRYDYWAKILLDSINFFIPNTKYLIATDISEFFNGFAEAFNSEFAKILIGIPDRYALIEWPDLKKPNWMDKSIVNLGKKIKMEGSDLMDFLRITKSSYSLFKILSRNSSRMIYFSIVP